jgi:3-deoxy-D-manno-octulosonate 8-phosphate phosphatase (KDO 8-P phosphatase)
MNGLTLSQSIIMSVLEKFHSIQLLAFDLDGVLTNGKVSVMPNGDWIREMDIKDGYALQHAVKSGLQIAVITGSFSAAVGERLQKLGIRNYFQNVSSKSAILNELMKSLDIKPEAVLFMGDDIPDLDAFKVVGLKTCPADAVPEIMENADYISPKTGGNGCVRDVIEKTMHTKGIWMNSTNTQSI